MAVYKECCTPPRWYCDKEKGEVSLPEQLYQFNCSLVENEYIGDWIFDGSVYQIGGMCKYGDYVYVLADNYIKTSPVTGEVLKHGSNTGLVYKFNVKRNVNRLEPGYPKEVVIGHGNGMCYNPVTERFYITIGHNNTDDGTGLDVYSVLSYDKDFNSYFSIKSTDFVPGDISYDHKTGKMWAFGRWGYIDYRFAVLDTTTNTFGPSVKITIPQPSQDVHGDPIGHSDYSVAANFAVRDNIGYLSGAYRNMTLVDLLAGKIIEHRMVSSSTEGGMFPRLGELEGIEFDERGYMYSSNYTALDGTVSATDSRGYAYSMGAKVSDMIVTALAMEIPSDRNITEWREELHVASLDDSTVNKFRCWPGELHHPLQAKDRGIDRINWNCSKDFGTVNFYFPITIQPMHVKCNRINFHTGHNAIVTFLGSRMEFTGNYSVDNPQISCSWGADCTIDNNTAENLKINSPILYLGTGSNNTLYNIGVGVRSLDNTQVIPVAVGVHEPVPTAYIGLWVGATKLATTEV